MILYPIISRTCHGPKVRGGPGRSEIVMSLAEPGRADNFENVMVRAEKFEISMGWSVPGSDFCICDGPGRAGPIFEHVMNRVGPGRRFSKYDGAGPARGPSS